MARTMSLPEPLQGLRSVPPRTGIKQDEPEHPLQVVRLASHTFPGGEGGGGRDGAAAL